MESNWLKGWLAFGDHPTPAIRASLVTPTLFGHIMGRVAPWTITVRKVNLGEIPVIPVLTYYNQTFISPGSFEAGYAFLESIYGPEF